MWDLSRTNSRELPKVLGITGSSDSGGPPGSRSRHLGIKRGMQMVGFVWWCRNHPRIKENWSGGVGFVWWGRNGLWEEMWEI
jgi:hypothetical protein